MKYHKVNQVKYLKFNNRKYDKPEDITNCLNTFLSNVDKNLTTNIGTSKGAILKLSDQNI